MKAWSESRAVQVDVLEEKGQLRVHVAEDAACGIHWIRLFDDRGATAVKPFIVGSCPEGTETEPNEIWQQAQAVELPHIVNGRLDKTNDVDVYSVELLAGQTLVASLGAHTELGSPMDGVLQILSPAGYVLEQNDDARGLDPLLVFSPPESGTYYLRMFGFPSTPTQAIQFAGGKEYVYRLALTTGGFLDHTLPLAASSSEATRLQLFGWNIPTEHAEVWLQQAAGPTASAFHRDLLAATPLAITAAANVIEVGACDRDSPQSVTVASVLSGRIETKEDVDVFQVSGKKDQRIKVKVEATALGSLLDPHVALLDAAGKVLVEADDTGRQNRDCTLEHKLAADGDFFIHLRDVHHHGGFRYFYRMSIDDAKPTFELSVPADRFTAKQGEAGKLEIEVTVDRQHGYDGEITIEAIGLPAAIEFTLAISAAKGETAKKVKIALNSAAEAYTGRFQLVGTGTGPAEDAIRRPVTFENPMPARTFEHLWLTIE